MGDRGKLRTRESWRVREGRGPGPRHGGQRPGGWWRSLEEHKGQGGRQGGQGAVGSGERGGRERRGVLRAQRGFICDEKTQTNGAGGDTQPLSWGASAQMVPRPLDSGHRPEPGAKGPCAQAPCQPRTRTVPTPWLVPSTGETVCAGWQRRVPGPPWAVGGGCGLTSLQTRVRPEPGQERLTCWLGG